MRQVVSRWINLIGCAVIFVGLAASPSNAQTIIQVPFVAASFSWDVPAPGLNQSPATKHTVVCGSLSIDVPMPATRIAVGSVVPGPGVYSCSLYASNAFGRQTEPNVPFPQFEAGYVPAAPLSPRIEVSP